MLAYRTPFVNRPGKKSLRKGKGNGRERKRRWKSLKINFNRKLVRAPGKFEKKLR